MLENQFYTFLQKYNKLNISKKNLTVITMEKRLVPSVSQTQISRHEYKLRENDYLPLQFHKRVI